jgi:succinyl-CoA synthetase beta subunit
MPTLSEADSKRLVARYGVATLPETVVDGPEAAVAAADSVGYPVVAKLCGAGIAHKTERGLVRLGLSDPGAVRAAVTDLLGAARPDDDAAGVLIAPMARGTRELIAGVVRDEQYGPCVMLGVGGVLAEAIADVSFRLVPVSAVDADEMIDDLRSARLLGPFRGEPAVDRAALRAVVLALSRLVEEEPTVRSVDLNPLLVVDGLPVAVDALVEIDR